MSGSSRIGTTARGTERRNSPAGRCPRSRATALAATSSSKAGFARDRKRSPASVRPTLRVVRMKSAAPTRASSARTAWLIADGVTPSAAAAWRKLRRWATLRNASTPSSAPFDECHHLSAASFELVARRAKARYVLGLSATVGRKDGHHPIIFMQCGPVRHRVDAKQQAAARPFSHQVFVRPTGFRQLSLSQPDMRLEFHELYEELLHDGTRNQMICADVLGTLGEGRWPLVLTERVEHIEALAKLLSPVANLIVLHGGQSKKDLKAAMTRVSENPADAQRVILATGKLVGEGFDDARLDTLFLALPISWRGTIAQYVGRLHRLHEGKQGVRVYDYADLNVPMLSRMFDKRCRGYEALGYAILLPASAMPGWPVEVSLPLDPEWKK